MIYSDRIGRYRSFALNLIASYKNEQAIRILGEFLKTAPTDDRFDDRDLSNALSALEDASGMRWRDTNTGKDSGVRVSRQRAGFRCPAVRHSVVWAGFEPGLPQPGI